jgi:BirA family biotin operon repressor/biotin-[acetyl-CoA-carboxylase] ligase
MKSRQLSPNLNKLVTILSDGQYHDGTSIGATMHMTRGAVWKNIKKLISYGIKIDSVKNKGYALIEPLMLLDKKIIKKNLNHEIDLDIFEIIDSTNTYLKKFFHDAKPRICIAEQQTKGKGRLQREWYSPFGKNIYLSCLFPFQQDVSQLSGLSLVVSLAIIETLKTYSLPKSALIKWPNDIMCTGKKLCGNLIELQAETNGACSAVIGIGLNVNLLSDEKHSISQPWTSLREIAGEYIDRNQLCAALINQLFLHLHQFSSHGLPAFMDKWKEVDYLRGQTIQLVCAKQKMTGNVKGIDQHGHLLMKLEDGTLRSFSSGDTSLRAP